jgi:hypothetical protein
MILLGCCVVIAQMKLVLGDHSIKAGSEDEPNRTKNERFYVSLNSKAAPGHLHTGGRGADNRDLPPRSRTRMSSAVAAPSSRTRF